MNYSNIYTKIIEYRRNNEPTGYYETHHILPRCLGGTDNKDNLVKLTAKEHFICHLLLTKVYLTNTPAHYKMCKAFLMMQVRNTEQGRHYTGLTYSKLKKEHRAYMSTAQQGHKNHQYGTKWVSNLELQKTMKVLATAELESGWFYGRVVNFEKYQLAVNNAAEKERALAVKQEKLTNWYTLYSQVGWKEFVKCTGCTVSQDNLTKQFSRYCDDFKPQSGRKRGL